MTSDIVFLLDVDNTLLDNDRIVVDLRRHLESEFDVASADRYWTIFEGLRSELGYADYLGALQRYRFDAERGGPDDQRLLLMSSFLVDYPFAERLFPRALEVIDHLGKLLIRHGEVSCCISDTRVLEILLNAFWTGFDELHMCGGRGLEFGFRSR